MRPPMLQGAPDDFQTPPEALLPLLPHIPEEWSVWEPAAGFGWLVEELAKRQADVVATDKYYKGPRGKDFLTWEPDADSYDCIITNPPYSLKQQFLARCFDLQKPFALLLPLTTFETEKRQGLMNDYPMDVILLPKRINFRTPSGEGSGSWFATAWFTWGLPGFEGVPAARCFVEY